MLDISHHPLHPLDDRWGGLHKKNPVLSGQMRPTNLQKLSCILAHIPFYKEIHVYPIPQQLQPFGVVQIFSINSDSGSQRLFTKGFSGEPFNKGSIQVLYRL